MQTTFIRRSTLRLVPNGLAGGEAIEWEDLPSFADSLNHRLVNQGARPDGERSDFSTPAWIETRAGGLEEATMPSEPFRETLQGLHTREVHEPEIFKMFFGN